MTGFVGRPFFVRPAHTFPFYRAPSAGPSRALDANGATQKGGRVLARWANRVRAVSVMRGPQNIPSSAGVLREAARPTWGFQVETQL